MEQDKAKEEKISLPDNPYARATDFSPIVRIFNKINRNIICPFTKKKFKRCCGESGQDFCTKAKDNLESHLEKIRNKDDIKS
jgi:hypothetical protein